MHCLYQFKRTLIASSLSLLLTNTAFSTPTFESSELAKLPTDEGLYSKASAISGDGKIIGGSGSAWSTNYSFGAATLWGEHLDQPILLPNLNSTNNQTRASVFALNQDGSVAGGRAYKTYSNTTKAGTKYIKAYFPTIWEKGADGQYKAIELLGYRTAKGNNVLLDNDTAGQVNALNAAGTRAVGKLIPEDDYEKKWKWATLWEKQADGTWSKPIYLGALEETKSPYSQPFSNARAISHNGKVIAGDSDTPYRTYQHKPLKAVVWEEKNSKWEITRLPMKSEHTEKWSSAAALNEDGSVAAGYVQTKTQNEVAEGEVAARYVQAVIWKKQTDGWHYQYLKPFDETVDEKARSTHVYALNKSGSIAAGTAAIDKNCSDKDGPANCDSSPALWYDFDKKPLNLGTLKADREGNGSVFALSDDGTVAVGEAESDQTDKYDPLKQVKKATLWKITYPKSTEKGNSSAGPNVIVVDEANFNQSIAMLADDTSRLLSNQYDHLLRLQNGCISNVNKGYVCYQAQGGVDVEHKRTDTPVQLSFGYGMTERFSAGISLGYATNHILPSSHKARNSLGVGIQTQWSYPVKNGVFYVKPTFAYENYSVDITRPHLANTELGKGRSKVRSYGGALLAGLDSEFAAERVKFGVYSGVRHNVIQRSAYREHDIAFPVSYDKLTYRDTAAVVGLKLDVLLAGSVWWDTVMEAERSLNTPDVTAKARYQAVSSRQLEQKVALRSTRGQISSGLRYQFNPMLSVSVIPTVKKELYGNARFSTLLQLQGQF
ncbi:hypothetical protein RYD26_04235 [Pasteurellaceae bacterium LIM206]|nr:hypothetical protein [Pasteurellaceae bacterium LIM206]